MTMKAHKPQGRFALGCLGLLTPRLLIILLVIVTDYIGAAFSMALWPILGFFFMPITTLAAAIAHHEVQSTGAGDLGYWAVIGVGVALDLGLLGGGSWGLRRKRRR